MTKKDKVEKVMREWKAGTLTSHGRKVTDYDQAVAIALSEAGLSKKYAEGGGIGFIPMDLQDELHSISKRGGVKSEKDVIGILNAIIDSGLTDKDLETKPTRTGTQYELVLDKKTSEVWAKVKANYEGDLKGNQYFSTLYEIIKRNNSNDNKIIERYKPFKKISKEQNIMKEGGNMNKYAKGGSIDTPKIYVADLEAYNNGKLVGEWLDLSDFEDGEEVSKEISKLLKKWGAEEYAIHDVENVPSSIYSEYMGEEDFDKIIKIYKASEENDLPYEVISEIMLQYEPEDLEEWISDHYEGHFDNDTDLAYNVVESIGSVSDLGEKTTEMYFDYDKFGRDLAINDEWEGDFDSDEDRGYDYVENMGGVSELGERTIDMYFDYEKFGRDLAINDYIEIEDGYYFRTPRYAKGGLTNERRYVNKSQDYEVRYAKNRLKRTGYKSERKFAVGGELRSFNDRIFGKIIIFKEEQIGKFTIGIKSGFNNKRHVFIHEGKKGSYGSEGLPKNFKMTPQISIADANRVYSELKIKAKNNQDLEPFEIIKEKFAVGGEIGDTVTFSRYGERTTGRVTDKLKNGYEVVTDEGTILVEPQEVISFSDEPIAKKKRFGFFEGGGSVESAMSILKEETNQYSMNKYGEPIDEETFMVSGIKKDGEDVSFRFIVAETVSGKDIKLTPSEIFDVDRDDKFAGGGGIGEKNNLPSDLVIAKHYGENYLKLKKYQMDALRLAYKKDVLKPLESELENNKTAKEEEIKIRLSKEYDNLVKYKSPDYIAEEYDLDERDGRSDSEMKQEWIQAKFRVYPYKYAGGGEIENKIEKLKKVVSSKMLPESVKAKAQAEIDKLEKELHESKETKAEEKEEHKDDNYLGLKGKSINLFYMGVKTPETKTITSAKVTPEKFSIREVTIGTKNGTVSVFPLKKIDSFMNGEEIEIKGGKEVYIIKLNKSETKAEEKAEHEAVGTESKDYIEAKIKALEKSLKDKTISETQRKRDEKELALFKGAEAKKPTTKKAPVKKTVVKKAEVKSKVVGDDLKVIKFFDLTESDWNKMALNERNKLSESYKAKNKAPKADHKKLVAKLKAKKGGKEYDNRASLVPFTDKRRERSESSDKKRSALPPGKRVSENGVTYYENRLNRTDLSKKDKFEKGGEVKGSDWSLNLNW